MAEKYMDSLPHLVALYYIIIEVGPDDEAAIAGRSGYEEVLVVNEHGQADSRGTV